MITVIFIVVLVLFMVGVGCAMYLSAKADERIEEIIRRMNNRRPK